jgi:hypothetical protein
MGTPHSGSSLAPAADRLAAFLDLNPAKKVNRDLLLILKRDSNELRNILDSFQSLLENRAKEWGRLRIYCFAEEMPVVGIGRVSPSANSSYL